MSNNTPRLRSGYPSTPQSASQNGSPSHGANITSPKLPDITTLLPSRTEPDSPAVPLEWIDAPTQRLCVVGLYVTFLLWRLYDFYHLTLDETESMWLFLKWIAIDGVCLFGLPGLRIPWLEWSQATMLVLFALHAILDGILMFRIPIPLGSGLFALTRLLYDREIAISERRVKPANILNNPSLILGRQIINILPEGSAVLNPRREPLCVDSSKSSSFATLSLQINQTVPISIELLRFDLETGNNETISITASQAKKMKKEAEKRLAHQPSEPLTLHWPVRKTGLYRLLKVVDETKMEVQKRSSEALVVECPSAKIQSAGRDRCRGDLSDLSLLVSGTPPLKIKYREIVQNKEDREISYQSIQPDGFFSPLMRQQNEQAVVRAALHDLSWAVSHTIKIPLNETLTSSGTWTYSIDEVVDALGNVVFEKDRVDASGDKASKAAHLEETLQVRDLPTVSWPSDLEKPLRVAKGQSLELPLAFSSTGKTAMSTIQHTIQYRFTPFQDIQSNGEHSPTHENSEWTLSSTQKTLKLERPGLYSLESVHTPYCHGEIYEPTSVLLINPDEPDLSITTEAIADKCAGNSIGLRASLEMSGTPPFQVQYTMRKRVNGRADQFKVDSKEFKSLRGQIEFKPEEAGHYQYTFTEIKDKLYSGVSLKAKDLVLEQDVKPSVSAHFLTSNRQRTACVDETINFDVKFQGEGPWTLEYEMVHAGKRAKKTINDISSEVLNVESNQLLNPGDYTLVLASVKDRYGCKESLQHEIKIKVSGRPKVAFGQLEGKRSVQLLENKQVNLPVRLSGQGPWTVDYHRTDGKPSPVENKRITDVNDFLTIKEAGNFQITRVRDAVCAGYVDPEADSFQVNYIQRPRMEVAASSLMENVDGRYVRKAVCENEEDAVDVVFSGKPPYEVAYQIRISPEHGSKSIMDKELNVPLSAAQVKMDTSHAGAYDYVFTKLGDSNYDHEAKKHQTLTISQKVNARPNVKFLNPGRVYSFCQGDEDSSGVESIPVVFTGEPPFSIDFDVKHSNRISQPQSTTVSNIESTQYKLTVPHRLLKPGNSILTVRRVRDARGCEKHLDAATAPRVQLSVHDLPSITPLDERTDVCVGDRIGFSLSGIAPFSVFYKFDGTERKASVEGSTFRRIAETPGVFEVSSLQDAASNCRTRVTNIQKTIHALPRVSVSRGRETSVDIHAGGEAEILFEFGGEPPFEFTFTRSENARKAGGQPGAVLETRTLTSNELSMRITASEEGTYEVVAIRDRHCSFARPGSEAAKGGRKLLT